MKGLDLARRFFSDVVFPAFIAEASDSIESMAFGLVGDGSECLGFDDGISRDHDWGPRVCIWIPEGLYISQGEKLQGLYNRTSGSYVGYDSPKNLDTRFRREGIIPIKEFYSRYLGTERPPENLRDWLLCPEEALSLCTNGEVFKDNLGEFSSFRKQLQSYFPQDIWLKKIASRCRSASRNGQYDIWRAIGRDDRLAAQYHKARFSYEAAAIAYLLKRRYRPYGKWIFRGLKEFGDFGEFLNQSLLLILDEENKDALMSAIEDCSSFLIDEMKRQNLSSAGSSFLYDHGKSIESKIKDIRIRNDIDMID